MELFLLLKLLSNLEIDFLEIVSVATSVIQATALKAPKSVNILSGRLRPLGFSPIDFHLRSLA